MSPAYLSAMQHLFAQGELTFADTLRVLDAQLFRAACGSVCGGCRCEEPITDSLDHPAGGTLWQHRSLVCNAIPIWRRWRYEPEVGASCRSVSALPWEDTP